MVESFPALFKRLSGLSSDELDLSAERLVLAEKLNVATLIAHIAEVSERKLALQLGYRSTFYYCRERLNLSEGAVALRLQVGERLPTVSADSHRYRRESSQPHRGWSSHPTPHGEECRHGSCRLRGNVQADCRGIRRDFEIEACFQAVDPKTSGAKASEK